MSGLDVHYDDLDLITANSPQRLFTLLHQARPLLLNFGEPASLDGAAWAHRIPSIAAKYLGPWELPVIGAVSAPNAALIRPDGYVAWVGDSTERGLTEALAKWFGPPALVRG